MIATINNKEHIILEIDNKFKIQNILKINKTYQISLKKVDKLLINIHEL